MYLPVLLIASWQERNGLEQEGYVEGAVFVLRPSMDWVRALDEPPPQANTSGTRPRRGREEEAEGPFAHLTLRAEYKGYKPWRVSGLGYHHLSYAGLQCEPSRLSTARQVVHKPVGCRAKV
jgi:hypothetical protein